jgi:hypothetical protein
MAHTIYGTFDDVQQAGRAAGALFDYGARREDLSIVAGSRADHAGDKPDDNGGHHAAEMTDATAFGRERRRLRALGVGIEAPQGFGTAVAERADSEAIWANDGGHADEADGATYRRADRAERGAKDGITTTTPGDAAAGAFQGGEIGLGLGIMMGTASLLIPGVGLIVGAGALASAIGAAMATTAAGAIAGGIAGYLKDQGVPEEAAEVYTGEVTKGGTLLALRLPSGKVDEAVARQLLTKYHGVAIELF